ncbi:hypothetical protein PABG_11182 [Paracoccidioides brasiliensis Pb03]|nr:hypothetical protein PABG_11182 [Paracoccidioides brasiliensis Pb03]
MDGPLFAVRSIVIYAQNPTLQESLSPSQDSEEPWAIQLVPADSMGLEQSKPPVQAQGFVNGSILSCGVWRRLWVPLIAKAVSHNDPSQGQNRHTNSSAKADT